MDILDLAGTSPGTYDIRRGRPDDAAPLAAFAARLFTETFGHSTTPEDLAAFLAGKFVEARQAAELSDPGVITFVAESNETIIGFTQVRRREPPPCVQGEEPVELWRCYVDGAWHGRGVAQALVAAARAGAALLGGRTVWLSVWEHNPRAIRFYGKCGFRDAGSHPFYVGGDRQTDRIMVLDLPAG